MLSTETENYRYSLNVQCVVSSSYFSRVSFLLSRSCYSDTFGLMFWQSFNTRKVDVYIFTPQKVMGSRMLRIEELSRVKTFYLGEISREIFPPRSDFWSPLFFPLRGLGFGHHAALSTATFFVFNYYVFRPLTSEK